MNIRSKVLKISWATVVVTVFVGLMVGMFRFVHSKQQPIYGVSFSKPQAQSMGLDWQETYEALLKDIGFRHVRLMSYWNQHEQKPGKYDFSDLDKQFEIANRYGTGVSLSVGLRQPRWPECHEPDWAKRLEDVAWEKALQKYIRLVVVRYKVNPALESWQLENEYFNRDFGKGCRNFSRKRLINEFQFVKKLDGDHPIIMTQSNQGGIPLKEPHPDVYGFSIYRRLYEARLLKTYITHPVPAWFHSFRAQIVEMIWSKPVIIHELQAEPWIKVPLSDTSGGEEDKTLSTLQLKRNLEFANRTGIKMQYLWGGEYWYWKKIHGNQSYWQIIRDAVKNSSQ